MRLLSRVDIRPDCVEISVRRDRLVELLAAQPFEAATKGGKSDKESEEVLTLTVRARLQRVGRELRMLVETQMIRRWPIRVCSGLSLGLTTSRHV